jgi:hypothetical protein
MVTFIRRFGSALMPAGVPVTQIHRGHFAEPRYWGRRAI